MAKAEFVRVMFNDISHKYDFLNDVLSLGTHRWWKRTLVKMIAKTRPQSVLDCATGTGDIAMSLGQTVPQVTGIDFSEKMIAFANQIAQKVHSKVTFRVADIQKLPFADGSFDAASISFGIRNVESLELGLSELGRVSKSLFILEFGQPKNKFFSKLYFSLLRLYVPLFGLISKRGDAYEYLIASSERFPCAEHFVDIMKKNTHYARYGYRPVFGGIAYIYYATSEDT
jgi:demethylmenaquinone methyltransferase/2-methoxy-6-polyprenyl-1,4-benzoquinol methylase